MCRRGLCLCWVESRRSSTMGLLLLLGRGMFGKAPVVACCIGSAWPAAMPLSSFVSGLPSVSRV
eukprot:scaffold1085_cov407-Prasinococcus_capsulatus_cf.AAC.89